MANKKFLWGMLALMLMFSLVLAGCPDEPAEDDTPPNNKFYGLWIQAVEVTAPTTFQGGSVEQGVGFLTDDSGRNIGYFKDSDKWYKQDAVGLYYDFTNTTYQYKTGANPGSGDKAYNYTFTDSEITVDGITKSYTLKSKSAPSTKGSVEGSLLRWDDKVLFQWSHVIIVSLN